jgi:hypothetical protein
MKDEQGFDPDETYLANDNPFWDGTPASHPAWDRGSQHTAKMIARQLSAIIVGVGNEHVTDDYAAVRAHIRLICEAYDVMVDQLTDEQRLTAAGILIQQNKDTQREAVDKLFRMTPEQLGQAAVDAANDDYEFNKLMQCSGVDAIAKLPSCKEEGRGHYYIYGKPNCISCGTRKPTDD